MSRVGKKPIKIPEGVIVEIKDRQILVKGPKGELNLKLHPRIAVEEQDGSLWVLVKNPKEKRGAALWGLFRNLISNLVTGVTEGFSKELEISGIGFKAALAGNILVLNVGYSHPVEFVIPPGIEIKVDKNIIKVFGADKQQVGQVAAAIRAIKKVEPYKGKGIKYVDELVRKKAGKVVVKAE